MPMPASKIADPGIVLESMPRIIIGQMFRDILDILYSKEGFEYWECCSFTELRRDLFEKPAGRWIGSVLKCEDYAVNIRPLIINHMLGLLVNLKWVERVGQITLRLTPEGKKQRVKIRTDMVVVASSLYKEKGGGDGTQTQT